MELLQEIGDMEEAEKIISISELKEMLVMRETFRLYKKETPRKSCNGACNVAIR